MVLIWPIKWPFDTSSFTVVSQKYTFLIEICSWEIIKLFVRSRNRLYKAYLFKSTSCIIISIDLPVITKSISNAVDKTPTYVKKIPNHSSCNESIKRMSVVLYFNLLYNELGSNVCIAWGKRYSVNLGMILMH